MIIGLTGSIGVGKSKVLEILKELSYDTLDLDSISHKLLKQDDIKKKLCDNFSYNILTDNEIDRKKLREIVFEDKEKIKILNSIMHPKIISEMKKYIENNKSDILIIEVPLLFELKLEKYFDKILLVYADPNIQLKRIMERNNINKKDALNLINAQIDIREKAKKTKYIIFNETNMKDLKNNVLKVMGNIKLK
ncbi:dephospho-CoA kinase [Caviibacter abscessus]|uniref:dephospho-CoA kinase n=1 Tax=Caviibacter abscessus TaxID=1766719 RepID=UPI00082EE871|nr:dephospho-CoA kinase [Caviibacter abscessus]